MNWEQVRNLAKIRAKKEKGRDEDRLFKCKIKVSKEKRREIRQEGEIIVKGEERESKSKGRKEKGTELLS